MTAFIPASVTAKRYSRGSVFYNVVNPGSYDDQPILESGKVYTITQLREAVHDLRYWHRIYTQERLAFDQVIKVLEGK